jgi:hypothetical protein
MVLVVQTAPEEGAAVEASALPEEGEGEHRRATKLPTTVVLAVPGPPTSRGLPPARCVRAISAS